MFVIVWPNNGYKCVNKNLLNQYEMWHACDTAVSKIVRNKARILIWAELILLLVINNVRVNGRERENRLCMHPLVNLFHYLLWLNVCLCVFILSACSLLFCVCVCVPSFAILCAWNMWLNGCCVCCRHGCHCWNMVWLPLRFSQPLKPNRKEDTISYFVHCPGATLHIFYAPISRHSPLSDASEIIIAVAHLKPLISRRTRAREPLFCGQINNHR